MDSLKKSWSLILVAFVLGFLLMMQKNTIYKNQSYHHNQITTKGTSLVLPNEALIESGICPVEGKGIVVTILDSDKKIIGEQDPNVYVVHDEDMLNVINELRAAGAEAISINGHRLVATSEIRCAGPVISINNERSAPPFIIKAIGNPQTLENALNLRGGIIETLRIWKIRVTIEKKDNILIPAYVQKNNFQYAKPKEGKYD